MTLSDLKYSKEEAVKYLVEYSDQSDISLDTLLALYLVLEDNLFFVLSVLQGQRIKFASLPKLKGSWVGSKRLLALVDKKYQTNKGLVHPSAMQVGEVVIIGDKQYPITEPVRELLGHYYLIIGGNNATE